jgi:hypothetical protein
MVFKEFYSYDNQCEKETFFLKVFYNVIFDTTIYQKNKDGKTIKEDDKHSVFFDNELLSLKRIPMYPTCLDVGSFYKNHESILKKNTKNVRVSKGCFWKTYVLERVTLEFNQFQKNKLIDEVSKHSMMFINGLGGVFPPEILQLILSFYSIGVHVENVKEMMFKCYFETKKKEKEYVSK